MLQRVLDAADPDAAAGRLYRDPKQPATAAPGLIPPALQAFASHAIARLLADPRALACALGEVLSEPKRGVWFDAASAAPSGEVSGVALDQRTRMIYDDVHVYLNGESFRAAGA